jgi:hypothetical protein
MAFESNALAMRPCAFCVKKIIGAKMRDVFKQETRKPGIGLWPMAIDHSFTPPKSRWANLI